MRKLKKIVILLLLGLLMGCQSIVQPTMPLGERYTIEDDAEPVRVAGTDLEIESCYLGEDFSEDGGDLWFGMSGTRAGDEFEAESYQKTFTVGEYEIEMIDAGLFGGCTLIVRLSAE